MKISHNWLKRFFDKQIPSPDRIGELLTAHSFEVESIEPNKDDIILDIKVLPDRSHDCLSHFGIAKEVSTLTGIPLKKEYTISKELNAPESNVLRIEVEDPTLCKRFSALVIENVEVKDSPEWLKKLLESIGQRPINNIVDATNFVMFSLGQPLHAYDMALLNNENGGYKITARRAREGEKVDALGGKEYALNSENLVICDGNSDSVLGIAAIRGGVATKITKNTKSIIIESANFDSVNIRKTAKELSVRTDASVRFESGLTPELTMEALIQVSELIFEIAKNDNTQVEGYVDFYPRRANSYKIGVSLREIQECLGIQISNKDVEKIFNRMGFIWKLAEPQKVIAEIIPNLLGVPYKLGSSVLYDSPRSFDCSSFTSYLYAEAGVAIPRMSVDQFVYGEPVLKADLQFGDLVFSSSKDGKVFFESVEWMKGTQVPEGVDHVGIYVGDNYVVHGTRGTGNVVKEEISNSKSFKNIVGYRRPAASDARYVVVTPKERLDLRIKEDLIEEIGRIYGYENISKKDISQSTLSPKINKVSYYSDLIRNELIRNGFSEVMTYAFTNKGDVEVLNPLAADKGYLRKNLEIGLQKSLDLNSVNIDLLGISQIKIFEIGKVFEKDGEHLSLGIGIFNPKTYKGKNVEEEITSISMFLDKLLESKIKFTKVGQIYLVNLSKVIDELKEPDTVIVSEYNDLNLYYKKFSQYPVVLRDIAVFVPNDVTSSELLSAIEGEAGVLLVNSTLFDEFVKGDRKSYAFRLVFQSFEKTLNDDEVNVIMEKVTNYLNNQDGWAVR